MHEQKTCRARACPLGHARRHRKMPSGSLRLHHRQPCIHRLGSLCSSQHSRALNGVTCWYPSHLTERIPSGFVFSRERSPLQVREHRATQCNFQRQLPERDRHRHRHIENTYAQDAQDTWRHRHVGHIDTQAHRLRHRHRHRQTDRQTESGVIKMKRSAARDLQDCSKCSGHERNRV